ncbi:Polyprotein of L1-like non-LTR retrotransposon Zorro 1, partial [Candida maltosa Xu316]
YKIRRNRRQQQISNPNSAYNPENWINLNIANTPEETSANIKSVAFAGDISNFYHFNIGGIFPPNFFRNVFEENEIIALSETDSSIIPLIKMTKPPNFEIIYTNLESRTILLVNTNKFEIIDTNIISKYLSTKDFNLKKDESDTSNDTKNQTRKGEGYNCFSRATDALLKFKATSTELLVLSLYAPATEVQYQKQLFDDLLLSFKGYLNHFETDVPSIVLLGDFNNNDFQETEKRKLEYIDRGQLSSMIALEDLKSELRLRDTYPIFSTDLIYTNCHGKSNRRIDRIYTNFPVDKLLQFQQKRDSTYFSTHHSIALTISLTNQNPEVVEIGYPRFIIPDAVISNPNYISVIKNNKNIVSWQTFLKECHKYSKLFSLPVNGIELEDDDDEFFVDSDAIFINYNKKKRKPIKYLESIYGPHTVTDTNSIIKLAISDLKQKFHKKSHDVDKKKIEEFLQNFGRELDSKLLRELDKPFDNNELKAALSLCSNQSSPGEDGVSFRLLKIMWKKIGDVVTNLANEMLETGTLPASLKDVVVVLVPKSKDPKNINDFRHIYVANSLLRLISVAMKVRLDSLLTSHFHDHHFGYIKKKGNQIAIRVVKFILEELQRDNEDREDDEGILSTDFKSAFESVNQEYIDAVMKSYNFSPKLSKFLQSFAKCECHLYINNRKSTKFRPRNCLIQGLPSSGIIFALIIEPIIHYLCYQMQGIGIVDNKTRIKTIIYADDLLLFFKNGSDLARVIKALEVIKDASGLAINPQKTQIIFRNKEVVDFPDPSVSSNNPQIKQLDEPFTHLGITYNGGDNIKKLIHKFKLQLQGLKFSNRSVDFKCHYINSRLFPMFYYQSTVGMINRSVRKEIMELAWSIFKGISMESLTTDKMNGGFGLVDIKKYNLKMKAMVIFGILIKADSWFCFVWRRKLQKLLIDVTIVKNNSNSKLANSYNWKQYLLKQIEDEDDNKIIRKAMIQSFGRGFQRDCLDAWFEVTESLKLPPGKCEELHPDYHDVFKSASPEEIQELEKTFSKFSVHITEPNISKKMKELLMENLPAEKKSENQVKTRLTKVFENICLAKKNHYHNVITYHRMVIGHNFKHDTKYSKCVVCHNKVDNSRYKGYFLHQFFQCSISDFIFKSYDISGVELTLESIINPELTFSQMVFIGYYLIKVISLHKERESEILPVDTEWVKKWLEEK